MYNCGYKYSKLGELKIYNRVCRSLLFLSEEERLVLLFILDRTIGWHKVWSTISSAQFVGGVVSRRGKRAIVRAKGTRLTSDQVEEALTRLRDRGAINIDRFGAKVAYKINEYWSHPGLDASGMWRVEESDFEYDEDAGDN